MNASGFEERIARAKEAARLASIAAAARGAQPPPAHLQASAFHAFPPRGFAPPPHPHNTFHLTSPASAFTVAAPSLPLAPPHASPPPQPAHPGDTSIPDDVKNRIDRLVEFIQRNGPAFEDTVREREHNNPNFAFLHPTAHFHDYFVHKKRSVCGPQPVLLLSPPVAPATVAAPAPVEPDALLNALSVGAMASVCKLARKNGHAPYTPLPTELLLWHTTKALPHVEPARLEIRLAEFYRNASAVTSVASLSSRSRASTRR